VCLSTAQGKGSQILENILILDDLFLHKHTWKKYYSGAETVCMLIRRENIPAAVM